MKQEKQFEIGLTTFAHEPDRPLTLRYTMPREEAVQVVYEATRIAADNSRKIVSLMLNTDGVDQWLRDGEEVDPRPRSRLLHVSNGRVGFSAVDLATGKDIYEPLAFISDLAAEFDITAEEIQQRFPSHAEAAQAVRGAGALHPLPTRRSRPR